MALEMWKAGSVKIHYSSTLELSMFVLDAGVNLLEEDRADLFYLTLSDYIQHTYGAGSKESDHFLAALDVDPAGRPRNLPYLEDVPADNFGDGAAGVICPITDALVPHHGALGSFVRVSLKRAGGLNEVSQFCKSLPQVEEAIAAREAYDKYELHPGKEGNLIVIPRKPAVVGSRQAEHDLSNLGHRRLRSYGGVSEQDVPLMLLGPSREADDLCGQWHNLDASDLPLN
ncbi:phosphonoacetate hydrolase [Lecanosticta acicola]|uniref:Phosphonoacetate hydrolase n=1 Tax=Lecanosticta acicola TaxID=111012 RepID=A0AAI9EC66_9PEZI|nr:phosphonoacetate hydrolase [Lecanosticta acicola]